MWARQSVRLAVVVSFLAPALLGCGARHSGLGDGASSPAPRAGASLAFDARTGKLILFGGAAETSLADTWVWQDAGWQRLDPQVSPPARENAALAYDGATGELVLFGGDSVQSDGQASDRTDTWTWDGTTWTQRHPAHSPPSGITAHLAYDAARTVLLLVTQPCHCGGQAGKNPLPDPSPVQTWTWRQGDWHAESDAGAPLAGPLGVGGRRGLPEDGVARPMWGGPDFGGSAGMAWDPISRRVLYVEHIVEENAVVPSSAMATWSWDGSWHLEHPASPPAPSADPLLAADPTGTLLFDGEGHTWQWDGHDWWAVAVPGPAQRGAAAIAYDSSSRLVRLFGGIAGKPGGLYGDTWTWDGTGWALRAGPREAQAVPQPQATEPASGISRERAIAIARKSFPEGGAVTRVDAGPRSRFALPGEVLGASGRVWVWAVIFADASIQGSCGPAGSHSCPPPARGLVVTINYMTGQVFGGSSPAPAWLLASRTPG